MCGIGGWALPSGFGSEEDIDSAMKSISYRGPDDCGTKTYNLDEDGFEVFLSHRRLSIIDIEGGAQPMESLDGDVCITYNGEIYNFNDLKVELKGLGHVFKTRSDTEILLHSYLEWGEGVVNKISGQFAFAIWDSKKNRLFFARDHYGIKPFYYQEIGDGVIFSSEIKVITRLNKLENAFESSCIPEYLLHRYVQNPRTMYKGILKLKPGHFGTWDPTNGVRISRFFRSFESEGDNISQKSERELAREFHDILFESVRKRMVSDVPFGAFLSGGIDSSTIVSMMSKISEKPVKTFSVGFGQNENSELHYCRMIAEGFECEHHELEIRPDDLISSLPELIRLRDAPVAEPSDIPILLLAKFASESVKMVLTGEGADEILGGYEKYSLENYGNSYRRIFPRPIRRMMAGSILLLPESFWRWKLAISTINIENDGIRGAKWFGGLNPEDIDCLLREGKENHGKEYGILPEDSSLRSLLEYDQSFWLPDNLLERGDRMTMAASLEARVPFLDIELAEFSSQLPDKMRVKGRVGKRILRMAMADILPRKIITRPKVGFRVPVREWFRGELKGWVSELLLSEESVSSAYYDDVYLSEIIDGHNSGRENNEKIIWTLISLEIFLRQEFL